MKFFISLYNL